MKTLEDPGPPITDRWVTELFGSMVDRDGPLREDREWTVEREWPSFSARFVVAASGDDRVALKLGTNWHGDLPLFVADEIARVRRLLGALPGGRVAMPAVFGASVTPPAIAMELIEAPLLFELLGNMGTAEAIDNVRRCGEAIGAYHRDQPAGPTVGAGPAMEELLAAARRAGVGAGRALGFESRLVRARSYRFSPNDFLSRADGTLVLLDPPHVSKYDYVHRDIGSFMMEIHRAIIGGRRPRTGEDLSRVEALKGAFLEGYATTGPRRLDDPADHWAVAMFETARISGVAYGRLRGGRLRLAARAAAWALWVRRTSLTRRNRASGGDQ